MRGSDEKHLHKTANGKRSGELIRSRKVNANVTEDSELISAYADGVPIRFTIVEPKGWQRIHILVENERAKDGREVSSKHKEIAITLSCVGRILAGSRHEIRLNYKEIGLHLIEIYRFRSKLRMPQRCTSVYVLAYAFGPTNVWYAACRYPVEKGYIFGVLL